MTWKAQGCVYLSSHRSDKSVSMLRHVTPTTSLPLFHILSLPRLINLLASEGTLSAGMQKRLREMRAGLLHDKWPTFLRRIQVKLKEIWKTPWFYTSLISHSVFTARFCRGGSGSINLSSAPAEALSLLASFHVSVACSDWDFLVLGPNGRVPYCAVVTWR